MGMILLTVFVSLTSFSEERPAPVVARLAEQYSQNKTILRNCMNRRGSPDKSHGCLDAYKYIADFCKSKSDFNFKKHSPTSSEALFDEACALSNVSDNQMAVFFELDSKSCVKGFETLQDRLMTLTKNRDLMDSRFLYAYQKNTCKEYRGFVNLCVYVDGQLKTKFPEDYDKMPQLDFTASADPSCQPKEAGASGIFELNHDLLVLSQNPSQKIYETLITNYRKRMPATATAVSPSCEDVRNSYANMGCRKFEGIRDGFKVEDPESGPAATGANTGK